MAFQETTAALTTLKAALDLTKVFVEAKSQVDRQAAVSSLQQTIISAQVQTMAALETQRHLQERVEQLDRQIAAAGKWDEEKSRYELAVAGNGNVAYRLKAESADGQAAHWLCPDCFSQGHKAFLTARNVSLGRSTYLDCGGCRKSMLIEGQEYAPTPVPKTRTAFNR